MDNNKVVQRVENPADLDRLREITSGILGKVCREARLGYGDELKLEIGAKVRRVKPLPGRDWWGAWMLGSRGTGWKLVAEDESLIAFDDSKDYAAVDVEPKIQIVVNKSITAFDIRYPELSLTVMFDNGYKLTILPSEHDDEFDLPYWELFTPEGLLKVGPQAQWSFFQKRLIADG